jgi:RNA polymerase sigma-70 factor (ECF subfamily)
MTALTDMLRKARIAVLRRGVPADDAEDLVQEAFLRLEGYERDHMVRSKEAFLVSAAVNLSVDRARRAGRAPFDPSAFELDQIASDGAGPDEILSGRIRLERLQEGMALLPERTRRMLIARRIEGLNYREIADREGATVSAVEKQVARATLTLMKWMDGW